MNHKIWQIAWPAILSNISTPLLGIVDTAILGHLDSTLYLGAVAIGASILSFIYWGFGFLRMGTTGLVARAVGAGDEQRETVVLLQSAVLAVSLATLVVASQGIWVGVGLHLMSPGEALAPLAGEYIGIRVYSAPAVLLTYAVLGWFIGHQDTRWPMVILVFTNALNILLDVLFIVVLDWKSAGAARATLCAEYAGCALALWLVSRRLSRQPWRDLRAHITRLTAYGELLDSNRFLFIRTICLLFSFAFFTAMSTRLGEATLAANTIMLNLLLLAAYGLDGFAYAAEGLAGNAAGGGDLGRFRIAVRACWHWSLATAGLLSLAFLLAAPVLYPAFTDHADVRDLLRDYHLWLVAMPLVAAPSYLLDGVFIGAARTRYMMHSMVLSLGLVYLPLWWLSQGLGNHGLWLAFVTFNGARGVSLYLYYRAVDARAGWLD
ncbi:MAG: MATE family efflux transporter [Halieaceae bacterium]|nr:MATE family efflux transporter [Halieaceae bacterium]